ncbi:MAG: hypothetical protein IJ180_05175 [Bacteroidales bacterium]|nr:hypothetical protein [Bacteroidales bacterium]
MKKKILYILCLCLFFADLYYSFSQHYREPIDGDVPESVLPYDGVKKVFADPFGVKTIQTGEEHMGVNRFFSHYFLYKWFRSVPFAYQKITYPLKSVYLTSATAKIIIQFTLILLIATLVCGGFYYKKLEFVFSCVFASALCQTCGATRSMGLIDPSITYTFFYALPLIFLCLYMLPFIYKEYFHKNLIKNNLIQILYSVFFLFLVAFGGAINSSVALVLIITILIKYFYDYFSQSNDDKTLKSALRNIPKHYYAFLLPLGVFALYSVFLGSYNPAWKDLLTLKERYMLLPKGFLNMFVCGKGGFGILFLCCVINVIILKFRYKTQSKNIIQLFYWICLFSLIYIILLPFGGYRPYRPLIIRYDTIITTSFLLIFYLIFSSLFIYKRLKEERKSVAYSCFIAIIITFFTLIDTPNFDRNKNEKALVKYIQQSNEDEILLPFPATVFSWDVPDSPDYCKAASQLMQLWNITDKEKVFYYKPEE